MSFDYSNCSRNKLFFSHHSHNDSHNDSRFNSHNDSHNDDSNDDSRFNSSNDSNLNSIPSIKSSLKSSSIQSIKTVSTGTTIVGLIYKNGIVLGADTRATSGPIVADKNCEKIHYISDRIYCCGAGTAADTEYTTKLISHKMELYRLNSNGRPPRVTSAMTQLKHFLFQYQGQVGAALILGGVDPVDGIQLYSIYPHGSVDKLPYCTMGSGSLAAMAILETGFHYNMNRQDAINLVAKSIMAGIFNDLGSGSNIDILVIPQTRKERESSLNMKSTNMKSTKSTRNTGNESETGSNNNDNNNGNESNNDNGNENNSNNKSGNNNYSNNNGNESNQSSNNNNNQNQGNNQNQKDNGKQERNNQERNNSNNDSNNQNEESEKVEYLRNYQFPGTEKKSSPSFIINLPLSSATLSSSTIGREEGRENEREQDGMKMEMEKRETDTGMNTFSSSGSPSQQSSLQQSSSPSQQSSSLSSLLFKVSSGTTRIISEKREMIKIPSSSTSSSSSSFNQHDNKNQDHQNHGHGQNSNTDNDAKRNSPMEEDV